MALQQQSIVAGFLARYLTGGHIKWTQRVHSTQNLSSDRGIIAVTQIMTIIYLT